VGDITHATLAILFLALLAVSTFWVLSPFLTSILWATVISVATWPMLLRLETAAGGRRSVAVAILTGLILLVVFVPVAIALITIVNYAQNITSDVQSLESLALPAPPAWLEQLPLGARLGTAWRRFAALSPDERAAALLPYLQAALGWFAVKAGGIGTTLLQFCSRRSSPRSCWRMARPPEPASCVSPNAWRAVRAATWPCLPRRPFAPSFSASS
jgi:predicted PurR-regulated permease PerM